MRKCANKKRWIFYSHFPTILDHERKRRKNPSPAAAFFRDLTKWMQPKIEAGEEILLAMDANEEWKNSSAFMKFSQNNGLYNIANSMYDELPPTKPSSGNTIDFLLGTKNVLVGVEAMGMVPYNLNVLGDHRGMSMDLNFTDLLGNSQADKQSCQKRKLKSKDKKMYDIYQAFEGPV